MSWSLKIRNGDLVLFGTRFDTVTQENKLAQDFRCFILERMGSDDMHPWYGSLLDGGVQDGMEVLSVISTTDWNYASLEIESDIRRMAGIYQQMQVRRAKRDRTKWGKSTLTRGELLIGISGIRFTSTEDLLYVTISIVTGNGTEESFGLNMAPVLTI